DLLKPLGIKKGVKNLVKLDYCTEDRKKVESLLKSYNIEKKDFLIGFGVGAAESAKSRMWPKERFAELADWLIERHNAKIILIGNNDEKKLVNEIMNLIKNKKNSFDFAGKINVREMFYLISLCRLFIGNDSGPMHVAAAQGVKTIGLFGCNLPVRFEPFGKGNYAIYKKSTQDACINVHLGQVDECRYGMENACVRKIQVEDVIEVVNKIVKKVKNPISCFILASFGNRSFSKELTFSNNSKISFLKIYTPAFTMFVELCLGFSWKSAIKSPSSIAVP
ncbi:glycosyltransferase family 9 protein, partial [Candidatus Woesearchaeota archaeon]|nr:glycosyltransferase family 9 protein [Candidatus Woesearchaeota archaeon]